VPKATELTNVLPDYAIWQSYDARVKADLFSTAVRVESSVIVIDPISLGDEARLQLDEMGKVIMVLVTNANHARAAREFANGAAIKIPAELRDEFPQAHVLSGAEFLLDVLRIDGAAPGECAFHDARDTGTLIVGDALINFGSMGFAPLPPKYCSNRKQMMRSLRRLLDIRFERIFFAHGVPILKRARDRLATLLNECS
jgi:glyoxylase-like metal-dependent hydrolase (beta-lactamase superfamily II)